MSALGKLASLLGFFDGTSPLSNRNYMVDGNFDNWTASSSAVAPTAAYSAATMYIAGAGTGGAATLSRPGVAPGAEPLGMTTPVSNVLQYQQTTQSSGTVVGQTAPLIVQNIESVRTLNGRSATFSCWLQSNVALTIPAIRVLQGFGTGGSPSTAVVLDKTVNWAVNGSATLQKFSVRIDLPSVLGKTLGSNGNDLLQIGLWLPSGSTYTLYTAQWQLEASSKFSSSDTTGVGGAPTSFEYRGQMEETARVQRYYYAAVFTVGNLFCASGNTFATVIPLPAWQRTAAAIGNLVNSNTGGGTIAVHAWGNNYVNVYLSSTYSGTDNAIVGSFTADARL